jgi:uncharacterized protein (UPF0332 family)
MSDYEKKAVSDLRFQNAVRCLRASRLLLEAGDYKSAANRSYYAVFYAIRAVLALDGKDYKKHSAVLSAFRKEYIKTGMFNVEYSNIISGLFEIRTDSDYDDFYIISKEEIDEQVFNAEKFLNAVEEFLTE